MPTLEIVRENIAYQSEVFIKIYTLRPILQKIKREITRDGIMSAFQKGFNDIL